MISKLPKGHPLRRLFDGLVEQTFMAELGMCDPRLTDYLGELLSEFVHTDHIFRLRGVDGQTILEVSRMEADAHLGPDVAPGTRTLLVNRYIGDFTLFWSGVYPETLRPRMQSGSDRLREFLVRGKRSYDIASQLCDDGSDPPAAVLRCLSQEFEACVHGLHRVRHGWESMGRSGLMAN